MKRGVVEGAAGDVGQIPPPNRGGLIEAGTDVGARTEISWIPPPNRGGLIEAPRRPATAWASSPDSPA